MKQPSMHSSQKDTAFSGFTSVPDPVYIFDSAIKLQFCNKAAKQFSDILTFQRGQPGLFEIFPPRLAESIQSAAIIMNTSKKPHIFSAKNTFATHEHPLRISVAPLSTILEHNCILIIINDLHDSLFSENTVASFSECTTSEEAPEAEQRRFLTNMTHELRTPLNGIIGITELLDTTPLSRKQREYTEIIRMSCNTLTSTVNSVLDFSRIENGTIRSCSAQCSPEKIIFEELQSFRQKILARHIETSVLTDKSVPRTCKTDSRHFRQIFRNLLDNAVKFTERGSIFIQASFKEHGNKQSVIKVTVTDTGIGIPVEKQKHLFSPFYQIDNSAVRKYGGIGLGLALSKRLVDLLGGTIFFGSTPGEGSSFSFSIPVLPVTSVEDMPTPDLTGKTVLAVELSYPTEEVFNHYMTETGAEPVSSSLDDVFNNTVILKNPDILVLSETIPRAQAIDCLERLRGNAPSTILLCRTKPQQIFKPYDYILCKPFTRTMVHQICVDIKKHERRQSNPKLHT